LHSESVKDRGLLLDVDSHRNEILGDEAYDAFIGIYLGIQPSATTSHRRRAEINQHGFTFGFGICQRGINIFAPFDWHIAPFSDLSSRGGKTPDHLVPLWLSLVDVDYLFRPGER
jgi:hypothetical protein